MDSNTYLQRKVKMQVQRRPEGQYDSFLFLQKPKCKQPKASEATACKVLYVRIKRDGWMEQRDRKWDVRDRIKYNPLSTLYRQRKDKYCQFRGCGLSKRKRYKVQVTSQATPHGQPGASHKVSLAGLALWPDWTPKEGTELKREVKRGSVKDTDVCCLGGVTFK